ncbi:FecR domain-containing protein [Catenovulum sp. 2E275]|uniref:FecR family protein n=1 Tax=Catenovulum sp. 2E275 TaxID=2980497 RepID=UPI0021D10367|nr:FecR domain-containing protein [Catenovulum sp. 2E275]MCU4676672.1 FecR domain-containing protein [Catenovulum sp. 2E275]
MKTDKLAIFEQAANWAEKATELTDAEKAELEIWLAQNTEHQQAYQKCLAVWQSENLTQALAENVYQPQSVKKANHKLKLTTAFGSLAIALLVGYFSINQDVSQPKLVAQTQTSQTQQLNLADGSQLKLAGETQLDFLYQPDLRKVELTKGESLFSVQHLTDHQPFIVAAGDTQIKVTGTKFSVDKNDYSTQVVVVEGSVLVSNHQQKIHLTAGQSIEIVDGKMGELIYLPQHYKHHLNTQDYSADWLEAYQTSLGSVIAKLDRQITEQISLEESSLKTLPVTGRFNLKSPKQTLKMIALASNLRVSEYPGQIIIRRN